TEFVTPMTFQAVSGYPAHLHLLDTETEAGMGHIELARWADVVMIAPASADFMARLVQGRADDLLGAVCLAASRIPLVVAPAMNMHMWAHPSTQENWRILGQRGVLVLGPDEGGQACGDVGAGRMMQPEDLVAGLSVLFEVGSLAGKTVLITAGPTREAIDPVRFLSNHSSGKMGYALATAAMEAGARVILVSGPVALDKPERVQSIDVVTAQQMHDVVMQQAAKADIFIATAAVADYRPVEVHANKLKKHNEHLILELEKTPDILALVKTTFPGLFCVGFAAETENLAEHARQKLDQKGIEMIAANWVGPAARSTEGTFGSDENALQLFWKNGEEQLQQAPKSKLARQLVNVIAQRFDEYSKHKQNNVIKFK
ncbi:MAG: bifunctional phosphopantothenoylcysteine decarboxylase/phosphopantothenate--cysteine ligase CoaBC, partial [Gammaproteobacteria bacterium]|nr:bifunctional phosphopantothenoylcysteine decarboxylase/phosphopantothenate--cysteine ligase CoaBC [Gammaproteobacteria bacterium]